MSTIRRMINKSGPPRFPIPKAKIFIFILNWSSSVIFQRTAKFFVVSGPCERANHRNGRQGFAKKEVTWFRLNPVGLGEFQS
jgi:hypothetical protein